VDDDARVVGIVTLENLAEYMMVAQASPGWLQTGKAPAT
jgi:hypothetical protein